MARYEGGHLGEHLDAYVDGALAPDESTCASRHLVVCEMCRADVAAERQVLEQMRAITLDPNRHANLVAGLLALDETPAARTPRACVAIIAPQAPAQYSSRGRKLALGALTALTCCGIAVFSSLTPAPMRTAPTRPGLTGHTTSADTDGGVKIAVITARFTANAPRVSETWMRSGRIEP